MVSTSYPQKKNNAGSRLIRTKTSSHFMSMTVLAVYSMRVVALWMLATCAMRGIEGAVLYSWFPSAYYARYRIVAWYCKWTSHTDVPVMPGSGGEWMLR